VLIILSYLRSQIYACIRNALLPVRLGTIGARSLLPIFAINTGSFSGR
jgi:hypothetical protein